MKTTYGNSWKQGVRVRRRMNRIRRVKVVEGEGRNVIKTKVPVDQLIRKL